MDKELIPKNQTSVEKNNDQDWTKYFGLEAYQDVRSTAIDTLIEKIKKYEPRFDELDQSSKEKVIAETLKQIAFSFQHDSEHPDEFCSTYHLMD